MPLWVLELNLTRPLHNAATFNGKSNIKIIGYQIFDYGMRNCWTIEV
jgi:hypothetical protein